MIPNEATAPKIKEPSIAMSINQIAIMVIFWKRVFFFRCIRLPPFE